MSEHIELMRKIDDEMIFVWSDYDIFIELHRIEIIPIEELLTNLDELKKVCEKKKIKLYNFDDAKNYVLDHYDDYISDCKKYNEIFDQLKEYWRHKELSHPLAEDLDFYEHKEKEAEASKVFWNDRPCFIINRLYSQVNNCLEYLDKHSYTSIVLNV